MPLDLNVILLPFLDAAERLWKPITVAMESIGRQVKKRLETADALERATRDFPELDFRENAVVMRIAIQQAGALGPAPAEPLWPASIRQELLLPRLFDTLRQITGSIAAAMGRFKTPTQDMFSRPPKFVDIFGHLGLLSRAFMEDYRPVRLLEDTAKTAMKFIDSLSGPKPHAEATPRPAHDTLSSIPGMLAGALLLIPAVLDWMSKLLEIISLGIRIRLLDELEALQNRVYQLRREILTDFFETLRSLAQRAMEYLFVVERILLQNLLYWGRFIAIYLKLLGEQLHKFSAFLSKWVNLIIMVASMIASALDALRALTLPGGIPLGDLMDALTNGQGRDLLMMELDAAEVAAAGIPQAQDAIRVLRALMRATLNPPPNVTMPWIPRLPDIYRTAILPYRTRLFDLLHTLRDAVVPNVRQIAESAAVMLLDIGDAAATAARNATRAGSPSLWATLMGSSSDIASTLFGGQRAAVEADALAEAYEREIVIAGMGTLAAAVPRYIGGVVDWWHGHQRVGTRGRTSPHILARRARLSRVRMPRLMMRVHGFDLTTDQSRSALLAELQRRMKAQVELAWTTGELQAARG